MSDEEHTSGEPNPSEEKGNFHLHSRLDHHNERLIWLEAQREQDRERLQAVENGLIEANKKIEEKFKDLDGKVSNIGKTVNRSYWLPVGGFGAMVGLGGLALWVSRIIKNMSDVVGG